MVLVGSWKRSKPSQNPTKRYRTQKTNSQWCFIRTFFSAQKDLHRFASFAWWPPRLPPASFAPAMAHGTEHSHQKWRAREAFFVEKWSCLVELFFVFFVEFLSVFVCFVVCFGTDFLLVVVFAFEFTWVCCWFLASLLWFCFVGLLLLLAGGFLPCGSKADRKRKVGTKNVLLELFREMLGWCFACCFAV